MADRFARKERWEEASAAMLEFAGECLVHSHLDWGTEAVERARGLWARAGHEEASPQIRELAGRVKAAWADVEDLVEWRRSAEDKRREALRQRLLNRSVLIAGGMEKPEWMERLHDLTVAELDWCESYRGDGDSLKSYAERIRNQHYAVVVHYLQKTGHDTGDVLKPACEEAGVGWVASTSAGLRGVEEALEGWVGA